MNAKKTEAKYEGFSKEERAAMKERAKELKELTPAVEARLAELVKRAVS